MGKGVGVMVFSSMAKLRESPTPLYKRERGEKLPQRFSREDEKVTTAVLEEWWKAPFNCSESDWPLSSNILPPPPNHVDRAAQQSHGTLEAWQ